MEKYTSKPAERVLAHLRKYPYEPGRSAAGNLGLSIKSIATSRWYLRKYENIDLPKPNQKMHAEQVKREGGYMMPPEREPSKRALEQARKEAEKRYKEAGGVTTVNFGKPLAPLIGQQKTMKEYTKLVVPEPEGVHDESVHVNTIDYIRDRLTDEEFAGYCKGNAMKAISRAGKRAQPEQALRIAKFYLDRLLDVRGKHEQTPEGGS